MIIVVILFNSVWATRAEDCECNNITPTSSGNASYPDGWECKSTGGILTVYITADTVNRNNYIEAWFDADVETSSPYIWSITGNGFHFNNESGPSILISNDSSEKIEIWADGTACGSVIITLEDQCGNRGVASVRQPDNGKWVIEEEITCGTVDSMPGAGTCNSNYYCIQGAYRYLDSWVSGTNGSIRWHPTGNCIKYSCTPYDRNYCYAIGYEPRFYHWGIQLKKKWIWSCP